MKNLDISPSTAGSSTRATSPSTSALGSSTRATSPSTSALGSSTRATSPSTFGRTELACRYFPSLAPHTAWQKLRMLLLSDATLAPLAAMSRRCFLPAETRLIFERLGEP